MLRGSCLCGEVRYLIEASVRHATHCHCSQCRKQHGAAFATYAEVPRSALEVEDPGGLLRSYESSPGVRRSFCGRCGSSLFWQGRKDTDVVDVALGTLDDDPRHLPDAHIFVGSRAPWYPLADDLPRHEEGEPSPSGIPPAEGERDPGSRS